MFDTHFTVGDREARAIDFSARGCNQPEASDDPRAIKTAKRAMERSQRAYSQAPKWSRLPGGTHVFEPSAG